MARTAKILLKSVDLGPLHVLLTCYSWLYLVRNIWKYLIKYFMWKKNQQVSTTLQEDSKTITNG